MQIALFINISSEQTKLFLKSELFNLANNTTKINILDNLLEVRRLIMDRKLFIKFYCNCPAVYTPEYPNPSTISVECQQLLDRIKNYNLTIISDNDKVEFITLDENYRNWIEENNIYNNLNGLNQFYKKSNNMKFIKPLQLSLLDRQDIITKRSLFDYCVSLTNNESN